MLRADFSEFLQARPDGAEVWIAGAGRSLYPLARSGDALRVRRCAEAELRPGDVAVFARADGLLVAHLVDAVAPVRTSTFLGHPDARTGPILGRVVALRRGGVRLPLPSALRPLLGALHQGAALAWHTPHVPRAVRGLRDLATSAATRPLRRAVVGPLDVQPLRPAHLEALLLFAGDHLELDLRFLQHQLAGRWQGEGAAVGALDARGRLRGFAFIDRYAEEGVALEGVWLRSLVVAPVARGLGVGRALIDALVAAAIVRGLATVRADVRAANARSLRLFAAAGWSTVSAAETAAVTAVLRQIRAPGDWVVLERRVLPPG